MKKWPAEAGASEPTPPFRRVAVAAILLAALLIAGWYGFSADLMPGFVRSLRAVTDYIRSFGGLSAAVAILLMVLHSFVPFPAEFVGMANGMLFGPLWGTVVTWVGAMLGAWLAFGLARACGRPFLHRLVRERQLAALNRLVLQGGTPALLFSRFVPVISFNLINYAAGLTALSWWSFTWATGIGILPLVILVVLAGDGMLSGVHYLTLWLTAAAPVGFGTWWLARRMRS